MGTISRGFFGRRTVADVKLPPGQYLTTDFPVLSAGPTPHIPLEKWEFTIDDGTNVLRQWNWKSFRELPTENITVDLHCVTRWSKLGTHWEGVSLDTILGEIETDAEYAMVRSYGDYTTNLPLADLRNKQAWIAFRFDDEDLAPEHGGPARLLVPHLYLWKSAKWVRASDSCTRISPGSGKASGTTSMETRGARSVTRVTNDVACGNSGCSSRRNADSKDDHASGSGLAYPCRRPARRRCRLTAPDGYSAVRSYSIASAPNAEGRVELTVERLPDGEVSPYLTEELAVGDRVELRGPIGGWFVWRSRQTEPIQLIAGGWGIVPLMAMIRSRASAGSTVPFRLLYSVREPEAVFYRDELQAISSRGRFCNAHVRIYKGHSEGLAETALLDPRICYRRDDLVF